MESPNAARPRTPEAWKHVLTGPPEPAAAALAAAAMAGDAWAQLLYGQHLLNGRGVKANPMEALRWFYRAAGAGLAEAVNMVGRCLDQGWGMAPNPAAAAPWFAAAAGRGLDWGMYNFATLLALGRGVPEDRPRALDLFRRAARLGHAKSMTMVGGFHEDGWVVPRNLLLAAYHYARAAEGGDFRGAFNHARMLIAGGRIEEAHVWLERARATGTPRFVAQVAAWLAGQTDENVRKLGEGW